MRKPREALDCLEEVGEPTLRSYRAIASNVVVGGLSLPQCLWRQDRLIEDASL